MSKSPAFQWYAGDYLSDTQHLTPAEEGAYCRLLSTAWKGTAGLPQCYIPADDARLARIVKMTPRQWDRAKAAVLELWIHDPERNGYSHKRLLAELERQKERSASAAQSANLRWKKGEAKPTKGRGKSSRRPEKVTDSDKASAAESIRGICGADPELLADALADLNGAESQPELDAIVLGAKQAAARSALSALSRGSRGA